MTRVGWAAVAVVGVLVVAGRPGSDAGEAPDDGEPLRAVVHVNFADEARQAGGLKNIANILERAPGARITVVCHGDGIGTVEAGRSGHAEAVGSLAARGVRFVACENTMRERSIDREDLLPGVGTVPSGAVELIRTQQVEGYAYFKP
ncbi:DsrE family protein [Tautonia plasticadhaerens]|uniref:DsrE/DsrF-like family protein n=1 Tax=Tautonia plasticadhaerens TaxID=2527974 RepID=A0A518GW41_9BACT|nr:DsrE family protein [Tautonia plasticadhaerens]QDV32798.1 DsrE/DsrF-like family protein [Tautonia plasticadhaerens]